jgi:hypothetical protein
VANSFHEDIGDGLHDVAWNADSEAFEGVTLPSWEEIYYNVDGEELLETMVSFSDMSAALSIISGWLCQSQRNEPAKINIVGAKAEMLLWWMCPTQSRYKSMADIARAAGVSRALLSKYIVALRNELKLSLSAGKSQGARETYRRAQHAAVAAGVHSSQVRRKRGPAEA